MMFVCLFVCLFGSKNSTIWKVNFLNKLQPPKDFLVSVYVHFIFYKRFHFMSQ